MSKVTINNLGQIQLGNVPNKCPFCHKSIIPIGNIGNLAKGEVHMFFQCPDKECLNSFIGYYDQSRGIWYCERTSIGHKVKKEFDKIINEISSNFVLIYNEAFSAEQEGLSEICGVGYRKSLEFLIKDYLIQKLPDLKNKIETKTLGQCINDHVEDTRLKSSAKRATWLGNDETHYVRKWDGKDLNDLKKLIDLTTHWIMMEHLTDSFEVEMEDGK